MLKPVTKEQSDNFEDSMATDASLTAVIEWTNTNLKPGQVFSDVELAEWAEAHGYEEKEEPCEDE